ncbi:MAG TPA: prepilin peptidase [Polyangiaceae bacterium]|nr:prepilin peptidase [Polyangiaceae bacterium]
MPLSAFPLSFLVVFAVAFGLALGSFLNVVIYRVPRGISVSRPPSSCPACGKRIRAWDNIPVLGWVLLRGKARCCGVPIAPRYPLVELLGGLMAWAVLQGVVLDKPHLAWHIGLLLFAVYLYFALSLIASIFIDLEHMILPDEITWRLAAVGLLSAPLRGAPLGKMLLGALLGYLVVWGPFIWLYRKVRGQAGMGLGDAKLLLAIGCWFGMPGVLFALLAGSVQGTLFALAAYAVRGKLEEPSAVREERQAMNEHLAQASPEERAALEAELAHDPLAREPQAGLAQARIPFGPFLSLAALEYLIWGETFRAQYFFWVWGG